MTTSCFWWGAGSLSPRRVQEERRAVNGSLISQLLPGDRPAQSLAGACVGGRAGERLA